MINVYGKVNPPPRPPTPPPPTPLFLIESLAPQDIQWGDKNAAHANSYGEKEGEFQGWEDVSVSMLDELLE